MWPFCFRLQNCFYWDHSHTVSFPILTAQFHLHFPISFFPVLAVMPENQQWVNKTKQVTSSSNFCQPKNQKAVQKALHLFGIKELQLGVDRFR